MSKANEAKADNRITTQRKAVKRKSCATTRRAEMNESEKQSHEEEKLSVWV